MEALPSTIDALSEIPESWTRDVDRDSYDLDKGDEDEEDDEEEEEEDGEEEEEREGPIEEGDSGVDDPDPAATYRDDAPASPPSEIGLSNAATLTDDSASDAEEEGLDHPHPDNDGGLAPIPPPPHGSSKSRRKRLRRRRSSGTGGASGLLSGGGGGRGGRRSLAAGPSLTAPFLTWLLWLEHCRRASRLESKAKSAARAFVVRAGALAPVLEACFRVLRASQVPYGSTTKFSDTILRLFSCLAFEWSGLFVFFFFFLWFSWGDSVAVS